jgi:TonB-dependent receptor
MYKTQSFKKKILVTAIASVAMSGFMAPAFAQEEDTEVVITGIRASLERSMDQKREASGVQDVITAEDIGKFPDTNLAESMQRIPGVSINREGGEGSRVTVRGLGPEYNLVTHNGRTIAKTTGDRSFNFAELSAELIAGVSVAKTASASTDSGGIGATIDIKSIRPLDLDGQKLIVSGKMINDTSWAGGDTPEIFALYANQFADNTVGVSVGIGYQERESSLARAQIDNGWVTLDGRSTFNDTHPNFGLYGKPQSARYQFEQDTRERMNAQLVVQWAPADNMTATLDFDTYDRSVYSDRNEVSAWFTFPQNDPSATNPLNRYPVNALWYTNNNISTPLIYSETYVPTGSTAGGNDLSMAGGHFAHDYSGDTLGLNFEWQLTDALSLEFDYAHSEAEDAPGDSLGSDVNISTAAYTRTSSSIDTTGDIFSVINGGGNASATGMRYTGSVFQNNISDTEVDQFSVKGKFEIDESNSIDFGIRSTEFVSNRQATNVQQNNWGGLAVPTGQAGAMAALFTGTDAYARSRFNGSFGNFGSVSQLSDGNADGDNNPATLADGTNLQTATPMSHFFDWDTNALAAFAQTNYASVVPDSPLGDCGNAFCASTDYSGGTDNSTTEETTAIYAQYNFKTDRFGAVLGLRYESTDVVSSGVNQLYTGTNWTSDTEIVFTGQTSSYVKRGGDYTNTLPSLDLSFNATDDVVLRASLSESIARPGYGSIGSNVAVASNFARQRGVATGNRGNPELLPYESTNFDVSAEWYYGDASYVSIAAFTKKVSNFIANETVRLEGRYASEMPVLTNPFDSSYVDQAIAALGASATGIQIRSYIFDNFDGQPGVTDGTPSISGDPIGSIIGQPSHGPVYFDMSQPSNSGDDRELNGLEFALQHMFGESGFGTQVNYTIVNTDLSWDVTRASTDQTPLIGVSDSANLVGFYDNNGWNVRVAYNWRDTFLNEYNWNTSPQFVKAYAQIDIGISYQVTDNLKVSLDGINVTDEAYVITARSGKQVRRYDEYGGRYMLGATYSF